MKLNRLKISHFGCLKLFIFQMRYLRIDQCAVPAAGGLNGPAPSHNDRTADPIFALSLTLIVMVMIYGCLSIFAAPVHTGIYAQNFFHSTNIAPLTMFWVSRIVEKFTKLFLSKFITQFAVKIAHVSND